MTLAIGIPDYSEYEIKPPYFGDMVYNALKERTGRAEKITIKLKPFSDTSEKVVIEDHIEGRDLFIVQPFYPPAARHLGLTAEMLDAARRTNSPHGSTRLVELFNPYNRQDSMWGREPVTARLVADIYQAAGMQSLITADLHAKQTVGFYTVPVKPLPLSVPLARYFRDKYEFDRRKTVVASPDAGGYANAEFFANLLGLDMVAFHKKRINDKEVVIEVLGDVQGKDVLLRDDQIGTGTTIVAAANAARAKDARKVYAVASHLVLSGNARQSLMDADIKVIGTNSIPQMFTDEELKHFDVFDVAPLTAEVIDLAYRDESISKYFKRII